jgi:hypothetical protein
MGAPFIVKLGILAEHPVQMLLAQDEQVVQALGSG